MKLLFTLLLIDTKMKPKNIIPLAFFTIAIVLIFAGLLNIFQGYITGEVVESSSTNITSIGSFSQLLDSGLISKSGDCESFGALQSAKMISTEEGKKLDSGTLEFNEDGCQADISELLKNNRDIKVEGVSVSSVEGVDKYIFEASYQDKAGSVNIDGKEVYLEKGDSIVLDSVSGDMEEGKFEVKETTGFDIGPFSTYINKGEVEYDSNDKSLSLPSGSEITNIPDPEKFNEILGEENSFFDIKGDDIRLSSGFQKKLFSFDSARAKRFTSFSGEMTLHKTLMAEGTEQIKYMASVPKGKSLSFPDAGLTLESPEQTDSFLFFEQKDTWFTETESTETKTLGDQEYYLESKIGQDIGTMNYVSLTDDRISGYDAVKEVDEELTSMTRVTLENYEVAGIDASGDKYLQASFNQGKFSIENGNIYIEETGESVETDMVLVNGKDKLTRMDGDLRLEILGGEIDKKPTSFTVNVPGRSGELVRGIVGNQYGDAVYSSSFMASEDYSSDLEDEAAVNIVHTDGSETPLSEGNYMTDGGVVGVREGEETIPEKYNLLLQKFGQRIKK